MDDFHTCFHLYEDNNKEYQLTNALEIHFISMVKFRKLVTRDLRNAIQRWLTFLDKTTPEATLQEVLQMDSAIQKANERLDFVSQDKEFLRAYQMREIALSDWTTGVNTAFEKGVMHNKTEVARNFMRMGLSLEQIAEGTGLSEREILSL